MMCSLMVYVDLFGDQFITSEGAYKDRKDKWRFQVLHMATSAYISQCHRPPVASLPNQRRNT